MSNVRITKVYKQTNTDSADPVRNDSEQLEEKADLGTNYAYKLENLEPNIKISTLEKIIDALNVDLQTFFDLTLKEESTDLAQLIDTIKSLPEYKQNKVISAINTIINETK